MRIDQQGAQVGDPTYKAMKLNASAAYFRLHTVCLFQRLTLQLSWLKFSARKMNDVSQLWFQGSLELNFSFGWFDAMLTGKRALRPSSAEEERAIYAGWRNSWCSALWRMR
jgi:hypothetical protein